MLLQKQKSSLSFEMLHYPSEVSFDLLCLCLQAAGVGGPVSQRKRGGEQPSGAAKTGTVMSCFTSVMTTERRFVCYWY